MKLAIAKQEKTDRKWDADERGFNGFSRILS